MIRNVPGRLRVIPGDGNAPPARAQERAVQRLLRDIAEGKYPPKDCLPGPLGLATELGVTRPIVREVLSVLEEVGVIAMRDGRDPRVRPPEDWNILDGELLTAIMSTPASVVVLTHYLQCRRILETGAAALAAQYARGQDLADMADAYMRMEKLATESENDAEANQAFHAADIAFHSAILRGSGNPMLPGIVEPIQQAMVMLRPHLALHPEDRVLRTLPEHKAIMWGVANRAPEYAHEAMAAHLATVEEYLREYELRVVPAPPDGSAVS